MKPSTKCDTKSIYSDKKIVGSIDNMSQLIKIMRFNGLTINDNVGRTVIATLSSVYNAEEHNPLFDKCMTKWLKGANLQCNIKHSYNIFPLGGANVLIKV